MKRTQKPEAQNPSQAGPPEPGPEAAGLKLRIEELEPRLAPQSSTSILD